MIIDYDRNPGRTPEEQLRSLRDSVQLALNEHLTTLDNLYKELLSALGVQTSALSGEITSLSERLAQEAQLLSQAIQGEADSRVALARRVSTAEETIAGHTTAIEDHEERIAALEEQQ